MVGCLGLFCFPEKKRPDNATGTHEKPSRNAPPLDATTCAPAGSPTQPDVPPAYSRYSGRTVPTCTNPVDNGPKSKEESTDNSEEAERRRQAEREEQERRYFFQML
ncbi:hypothetical protein MMYC01_203442 [Madurella mycetomatis]|uniref:Uncharacterized protein n=1 Tax=Madurella mycetomatis TaxID=100816 RepID=A0A175WAR6_9PEZI|nr:hypothetical protein MMYC01_203442 [Madurella mycetomatis]